MVASVSELIVASEKEWSIIHTTNKCTLRSFISIENTSFKDLADRFFHQRYSPIVQCLVVQSFLSVSSI